MEAAALSEPLLLRRSLGAMAHGITATQREQMSSYESLDFDCNENEVWLRRERSKTRRAVLLENTGRWVLAVAIAANTGLIAFGIDALIKLLSQLKFNSTFHFYEPSVAAFQAAPFFVYVTFSLGYVALAAALVSFVEPCAAGSGIPEIKSYLNGVRIPRIVRLKTLVCKALGVLFSVSGGLLIGKEGPMIHSGAIVAAGLSQGKSTSMRCDVFRCLLPYRNDREKRDFVAGGAAAGVSAAFGAPIGGILFSLEEGASFWNQTLTWRTFFCSMLSTFTLNIFLSGLNNEWGQLSQPGLIDFGEFSTDQWALWEIPFFLILGVAGGLFGAIFNALNEHLTKFRMRHLSSRGRRFTEALVVALVTALASFVVPFFVKQCRPFDIEVDLRDFDINAKPFGCPAGTYNDLAQLFFNGLEKSIKNMFHGSPSLFSVPSLSIFFLFFFLIACWTYGIAVPSGLFVPSFVAGAAYGRLFGHFMYSWFPERNVYAGSYALVGAASMLAGMARMTISLTVIIIEATGDISYGMPLMLTIMTSKFVGDVFNAGLYDIHIELKNVPFLEWDAPLGMCELRAQHVMTSELVTLLPVERVGTIRKVLSETAHNGFPVVDATLSSPPTPASADARPEQGFGGLITRHELCVMLTLRAFESKSASAATALLSPRGARPPTGAPLIPYRQFWSFYPRWPTIENCGLSPAADDDCLLDLRPYMNRAPFTVQPHCSLQRCFLLFRTMGLRHLCVVDGSGTLRGIVTRKDLAHLTLHAALHLYKDQLSQVHAADASAKTAVV